MDTTNNPSGPDATGASAPEPLPPVGKPVKADHTNAMLCHLLSLSGYVGIPFGNVLGPLIWWLFKKDSDSEVDQHGKESLNFQISVTIYLIVAGLLVFVFIGFILLPIVYIGSLVLTVMATVKASRGEFYRYPFTLRLIK